MRMRSAAALRTAKQLSHAVLSMRPHMRSEYAVMRIKNAAMQSEYVAMRSEYVALRTEICGHAVFSRGFDNLIVF